MRRAIVLCVLIGVLGAAAPAHARPYWKKRLDRLAQGRSIGIAVSDEGRVLYQHDARRKRAPASNEKLLLSMALFDRLDPNKGLETRVFGRALRIGGVVTSDLWLTGQGDPTVTAGGSYGRSLPLRPTKLGRLARAIKEAGITAVRGSVMGHRGYFKHDWYAPGWKYYFPGTQVALPSALTFDGNVYAGRAIRNPEYRAAQALTRKLEAVGVDVGRRPGSGWMPTDLAPIAGIRSRPLATLARFMNRTSSNFFAEMLGKRLGAEARGAPGTIAKGGNAIEQFAARVGVTLTAKDSSGLSYRNRVSPRGMTKLLGYVEENAPWYQTLRHGLATGGQGTLGGRLYGVPIRAKTGSLNGVSALSGWIYLRQKDSWAEFSILSRGMAYYSAKYLEDRIIRVIQRLAR